MAAVYQWRGDTPANQRRRERADVQWAKDQQRNGQARRRRREATEKKRAA